MEWKQRNLRELGRIVCGDADYFMYRSSKYITQFFEDCDLEFVHRGETRPDWCAERIKEILAMPSAGGAAPPDAFLRVIQRVLDKDEAQDADTDRSKAIAALNVVLVREGWEAFYDGFGVGQLRHIATNTIAQMANPHRPFTPAELERSNLLVAYLEKCSEDELIEEVLLPLFRQLGFHRITNAGHRDKALEYGKDIWMKFTLPTLHVLYFGIQAKKGKLDASGVSTYNIAEIHNQVNMMLGHEIFDPELNRRVLVDHAFIVAGGEITKPARNWLGNKLDAAKRSQIMFMDRKDIVDLFTVTNLPLPRDAIGIPSKNDEMPDEIPF
ncbi:hypothetical protein [Tabrizicola sp. M-4]|uniref:hypothetical protein n=1 Tax=Tabrizicola sp. M-4 TaxID=3055847 RepID=UPI003DA7D875